MILVMNGIASDKKILNIMNTYRPQGYKTFLCSTQLSMKFIMLINVKMPTIVGILSFISTINTTSESLKAIKVRISLYFRFYERLNFHTQLSCELSMKKSFIPSGPAHEILVLTASVSSHHGMTPMSLRISQSHQSLFCSHTQNIEDDEGSDNV